MTRTQPLPTHAVLVGTVAGRAASLLRRLCAAVIGAGVVAGLLGGWRRSAGWCWGRRSSGGCGGICGRSGSCPSRRLALRGPWRTREHDLAEVEAAQVWCGCGTNRHSVAPHRDGMEVLLRGGRSVRVESGTAFPPEVAMTLSELVPGVRVVDWGKPMRFSLRVRSE